MFQGISDIRAGDTSCKNNNPIVYLACKKIFDRGFDARGTFLKYTQLERSGVTLDTDYKGIIRYWNLDDGFTYLVEKTLTNKRQ